MKWYLDFGHGGKDPGAIGPTNLKESDVVFYQKVAAVAVPFFIENLWTVSETQIIAVVAESLTERFNNVK